TETASDVATATTEAASDAATAATDTVTATTDAATDTAAAATDTAAAATDAASGSMMELLTVDGFNLEKVTTMLEGSDLGAVQKTMLTNGLKAAQDNPDLLKSALDAVRQALGM
ncbi:MAG: translation initiation factor 3, partial [Sulfitobacter sp.]|nr:translation initiation factor 3 [Sulfitobacter sp.]